MKIFIIIFLIFLKFSFAFAKDFNFYVESAFKNNPKLNAERENLKSIKQNINISRSEFLPSISLSGKKSSNDSTNRTDQAGSSLNDVGNETVTKTFSVDQKVFQGFQGFNSLKKSELEVEQGVYKLEKLKQEIFLSTTSAYMDLIYKTKNREFNKSNVGLFERQVESDSVRMQKGEITLTDLAQSESSLAGAKANLISSETELVLAKINFEKITRAAAPKELEKISILKINLPKNLPEALKIAENNNPKLKISQLDFEIAKKNVSIEKANLSPSASVNYSRSENSDYSPTVDNIDEQNVKATITWPIISGGKNYSSIKKSKYKRNQSELLLDDTFNEIKSETTNAWSVYQSAESVLKATQAQLKAAEIANEGITLEYDSGNTRTTLEVIQSTSLLLNARISNAKANRDFVVSKFKLLVQLGTLTKANIIGL